MTRKLAILALAGAFLGAGAAPAAEGRRAPAATAVSTAPADSDGDGYTDYEETHDPLLTNPQADYHTPGVRRADPRKPDIFIEVDFMTRKTKRVPYFWSPWTGTLYATVTVEGAHRLDGEDAEDMIARFAERGWNVHIVVDDEIPHEDTVGRNRWDELAAKHRDYAPYYHVLIAHKAGSDMAGKFGTAWRDRAIIFDGEAAVSMFQGQDVMHEVGHLLIDSARTNPNAKHLLDEPDVWSDGVHCPYDCVMNYASKLGLGGLLSQWWEFDYDWRCWRAVRGRYQF